MSNEMFTQLPTVTSALAADIICAVQGGVSVQETLAQVIALSLSSTILHYAGNPNGSVAGVTYQLLWDTTDSLLWINTVSGNAASAVWVVASGIVAVPVTLAQGGTSASLTAANGAIPYSTASALALLAPGTTGQLFQSGGAGAPNWTTTTYPTTNAINTLLYASSANVMAALATLDNGILVTGASGIPAMLANGTPGFVLTANSGAPPSWQSASAGGAVTTIDGDAGSATPAAGVITMSGGSTGLTTSASGSTVDITGTLAIAHGGTAKTAVTIAPTATAWAGWDANENLSAENFLPAYATTATAAGTTTLLVGSAYYQFFTGSTTQTVILPVTSTLVLGQSYYIVNNSSGNVTVQSSGANNIQVMATGTSALLTVISTSGTTAASWNADYAQNGGSGSGTVNSGTQYELAYYASNGTAVSGLATSSAAVLTTVSNVPTWANELPLALGGTNAALTANDGGIFYSTSSAGAILPGTASADLALLSGSNSAPVWSGSPPLLTAGGTMLGGINFFPTTLGIVGTLTNDNASAGYVGEFISSVIASGSPVSLTNATPANITSISLTAGDWDVWGNISVNTTVSGNAILGWISSTSATPPDSSLSNNIQFNSNVLAGLNGIIPPQLRFSLSGTTTIYLSVDFSASVGTLTGWGGIYARRAR